MQEETLDPSDWAAQRALGHRMVDDMFDFLQNIRSQPAWRQPTDAVKTAFNQPLPTEPTDATAIYADFLQYILPYYKGNIHPRFFSWVEGNGTPLTMLADMLAAGMNVNNTIGDHAAMYVDQQVIEWCKALFNFPDTASGILVSGGSLANITGLMVARNTFRDLHIRKNGIQHLEKPLVLYASTQTHTCVQKAAEALGLGQQGMRLVAVNAQYEIDTQALRAMIIADIAAGNQPFCVIGNAGTVNTAAIDPIDELRSICDEFGLWLHIDGAFGALAKLTPAFSESLRAIEQADSLAFDLHKWLHVPYESGCLLVRDRTLHRDSFALTPSYLLAHERGLAAGPEPMNNYGMELSRSFKALKVWMHFREQGVHKLARLVQQNIDQAHFLGKLVENTPLVELVAPVTMNIVCFRFNDGTNIDTEYLNTLNKEILMTLQERGIATPSYTLLNGEYAIRVNITNHRTRQEDLIALVEGVVSIGERVRR